MNPVFCTIWQLDMNSMKSTWDSKISIISFVTAIVILCKNWHIWMIRSCYSPIIIADIYWKYPDCNKSFSKVTTSIWYSHDGTIQRSCIWRIESPCFCSCRCCIQVTDRWLFIFCFILFVWLINVHCLYSSGQWLMRGKATQFWLVVRVGLERQRQQKCLCGILHILGVDLELKGEQLNNKF